VRLLVFPIPLLLLFPIFLSFTHFLRELPASRQDGGFQVELGLVRGVDVDRNAVQSGFDGLLRAGVQHFVPDARRVGIPRNEHQLGRRPAVVRFEVQIDQTVAAIVLGELGAEIVVRFVLVAFPGDDDLRLVLDFVNVVPELLSLVQFERGKRRRDFVVYGNSSRLRGDGE